MNVERKLRSLCKQRGIAGGTGDIPSSALEGAAAPPGVGRGQQESASEDSSDVKERGAATYDDEDGALTAEDLRRVLDM